MRVVILKNYAKEHFPSTPLIDYAVQVEQVTTSKVCFVGFFIIAEQKLHWIECYWYHAAGGH